MDKQHPITPPPDLRSQWFNETPRADIYDYIIEKAAQYGADQELEACCEVIEKHKWFGNSFYRIAELRAARRPKPPSLKQQALETLKYPKDLWSEVEVDTIRRALESIPDSE